MAFTYTSIKKMSKEFSEKKRKEEEQISPELEKMLNEQSIRMRKEIFYKELTERPIQARFENARNNIEGGQ